MFDMFCSYLDQPIRLGDTGVYGVSPEKVLGTLHGSFVPIFLSHFVSLYLTFYWDLLFPLFLLYNISFCDSPYAWRTQGIFSHLHPINPSPMQLKIGAFLVQITQLGSLQLRAKSEL
ncbi:hypothetical protein VTO42DRAFT_640 [Malbranchea cinnamomea]